ncbi:urea transporter [Paxillus ammoniavirescens]|nr:urea transporter [Paxillus ammoniavirescens]
MSTDALPQGAGYGVVVGIGLFFSAFMVCLTAIQARYTGVSPKNSEEFTSASRSVKPGLIASGIVSAWTWAATLLQSSAVAYRYGISGPWWYAAGATVQVLLFAQLAAKLKLNAPYAHTWLEIVAVRWGTVAHLIFMFFGLATNLIVSSMLVLGGSATVTGLTGMSTIAACFLIPLGVAIYVVVGGMRSTLLCDYTHTTVLFAIILTFVFTVYASSGYIGSISKMHYLLSQATAMMPVSGNAGGSYLTLRSKNGLIFGVINLIGNFATVFQDQAYWQRAIASRPATTVKAYLIGGIAWFAIPFAFSTTLGLAAVAFSAVPAPSSPTQVPTASDFISLLPPLTPDEISAGLPASFAAATLLGQSGAAALLIVLFLAVTSATSAELIAVSSILTYDIYVKYFNPKATEEQILRMSHAGVAIFALVMGLAGVIFFYIGVSMGWLYTFMGVILGSAVVPIALCITWSKASRAGCVGGAVIGLVVGIAAWLGVTDAYNAGVINVTTSGGNYEMLAGNLASIGVGGIVAVVASLIWPENYDFAATRAINLSAAHKKPADVAEDAEDEKKVPNSSASTVSNAATQDSELDPVGLKKAFRFAAWSSVIMTIIFMILIPLPLFGASTIFSTTGFTVWVVIGILWTFCSAFAVVLYPLWESREALTMISKGMIKDIFAKGSGKFVPADAKEEVPA